MKFKEIGRFNSDYIIYDVPLKEIALIKEEDTNNFGICVYPYKSKISSRDATVLQLTENELRKLQNLILRALYHDN